MKKFFSYLVVSMLCVALLGMVWYVISEARIAKEVRDSRVLVARLRNLVELRCKFSGILKGKVVVNCNKDGSYTVTRERLNKFLIVVIQKETPSNMLGFSSSSVILTGDDPVNIYTTTDGEKIDCKTCKGTEYENRSDFNRFVKSLNEELTLASD